MSTYNLNLTQDYCSDWGFWEAIREIIQNGEDQQRANPENTFSISYDKDKEKLTLSNKESILDRSTILMGKTSKKENEDMVGQYGEGYKVALAVLTRLGKKVTINNFKKNEKWTPVLVEDKSYDGEKVVKIKIDKYIFKRTPDHNLTWVINNVSEEDWNSISDKYLPFAELDESQLYENNNSSIIFAEEFKGKIFVNGLFVSKAKNDLAHGYNFHPSVIKLDRDRRTVENFDLHWNTSKLLQQFAKDSRENSKYVISLIKNNTPDSQYVSQDYFSTTLQDTITEEFTENYGEKAFPVTSQEEIEVISKNFPNVKPVIVNKKEKEFLSTNENFKDIHKFVEQFDSEESNELSPSEILNLFLLKHKNDMNYTFQLEFEELINQSKSWEVSKNEIPSDNEEGESKEEELYDSEINEHYTTEEKEETFFKDAIPF